MFHHLHSHTDASIADGLFGPKKWARAVKDMGFKSLAVTDHGVMTNLIPFYNEMKAEKIVPIMGCEFYYVDEPTVHEKENRKASHLVLLAKNYEGFQALLELSKLSFTEGFYFRPRIGMEWLKKYHGGNLICLSACIGGVLARELWKREDKLEHNLVGKFQEFSNVFGNDFYVEFQGHNIDKQVEFNKTLFEELRLEKGFQPVVTNDNHYILPEHAQIQTLLKAKAYRQKSEGAGQSFTECDSLYLKTPKEIFNSFQEFHDLSGRLVVDGMKNTEEIFEKCVNFEMPTGKRYLPKFKVADTTSKDLFRKLTSRMLVDFINHGDLKTTPEVYKKRFIKEFKVISKYGLEDYFLIVWDLVRFAKSRGIFVGIGRGSAGGCLISYLMGIVKIDPMEYDLLFERFLNEYRCEGGELPDIDLDFESRRREEIKEYIFQEYGRDKVCEIGTYGRIKLKTAILDFGKALGMGTSKELLKITTQINSSRLEEALEESEALMNLMVRNPIYAFIVDEIHGQMKSQGVHPAGVLISSEDVHKVTPLKSQKNKDRKERILTTQAEDKHVISQGLVKMDILGLKEYDIIKFIIESAPDCDYTVDDYMERIINEEVGNDVIWDKFQRGESDAVFQFASDGMKGLLYDMQPDCIGDLTAANALYRPGCLRNGWHTLYCRRKSGEESVEYLHPIIEEITKNTYGVIVYQEQVMAIINKLGGVSLVEADTIRSALGKKSEEKLAKYAPMFIEGASKHIGKEGAEKLWEQLMHSTEYSFNKSHSVSYAVLAFISQTLKMKWPVYFWAANLEWDSIKGDDDKKLSHKKAAQDMKVEFLMPDINNSKASFVVEDGKVRWSFLGIKGVGEKTAKEIEKHQPYESFDDFFDRVHKGIVKVNNMENLIYAGVFDSYGDRRELIVTLFEKKSKPVPEVSEESLVLKFSEVLGFFERKLKFIKDFSKMCVDEEFLRGSAEGEDMLVGGMISEVRSIKTKGGDPMGFITIIDLDERIEVTAFPSIWAKYRRDIRKGNLVEIQGSKSLFGSKQNQIEATDINVIE